MNIKRNGFRDTLCQVYKDDNHKPEMAVALTAFEVMGVGDYWACGCPTSLHPRPCDVLLSAPQAMCGFRSIEEIAGNLTKVSVILRCAMLRVMNLTHTLSRDVGSA